MTTQLAQCHSWLTKSKNSTCFLKQMDTLPEVRRRVTDMKCSPAGSLFDGLWTPPAAIFSSNSSSFFMVFFLFLEPRKCNYIVVTLSKALLSV